MGQLKSEIMVPLQVMQICKTLMSLRVNTMECTFSFICHVHSSTEETVTIVCN